MPLKESYVIWNNKGGVGKSTLTFHIASHYSRRNPTEKVLVIDLCPQANVSMALLSSKRVPGSEHLSSLYNANKTISFYLQRSIEPGPVIKGREYLTAVHDFKDQMPSNLFLLCGDMYLELVGRHLEHERSGIVFRGTQQKILRKRLKNNKKARIKISEAIWSILGDCWEKFICSSLPARLMKSGVPSQRGAPSTCDLTYLEVS